MSTRCIVGVDGCPDGWLYVVEGASGVLSTGVASDITTLMSLLPNDAIVAIDVDLGAHRAIVLGALTPSPCWTSTSD